MIHTAGVLPVSTSKILQYFHSNNCEYLKYIDLSYPCNLFISTNTWSEISMNLPIDLHLKVCFQLIQEIYSKLFVTSEVKGKSSDNFLCHNWYFRPPVMITTKLLYCFHIF